MINLGDEAKDSITGFKGVVTGKTEFLNGCVRYLIQPKKLKDEKMIEAEWVDEQQLKVTKVIKEKTTKKVGGPSKNPPKH